MNYECLPAGGTSGHHNADERTSILHTGGAAARAMGVCDPSMANECHVSGHFHHSPSGSATRLGLQVLRFELRPRCGLLCMHKVFCVLQFKVKILYKLLNYWFDEKSYMC